MYVCTDMHTIDIKPKLAQLRTLMYIEKLRHTVFSRANRLCSWRTTTDLSPYRISTSWLISSTCFSLRGVISHLNDFGLLCSRNIEYSIHRVNHKHWPSEPTRKLYWRKTAFACLRIKRWSNVEDCKYIRYSQPCTRVGEESSGACSAEVFQFIWTHI